MLRFVLAAACLLGGATVVADEPGDREGVEFFETQVRPLLVKRCYQCHSQQAKLVQGGLKLDTRAAILHGGDSGEVLKPGKPDESLLVEAVKYDGDVQMPPSGKLPAAEIALLADWVRRGAPLPSDGVEKAAKAKIDFAAGRRFWSFQPPRHHPQPTVASQDAIRRPIDGFILDALAKQRLTPSPQADRRTLIRRVTFDLVGLPPTPEEVEAFVKDDSPGAYERLVDSLLESPHYGERWARFWLDLARYSDKTAPWLDSIGQAWLYRDWVVKALNDDVPYDEFVLRQLAADQMPAADPRDLAALGFLGLSPVYWKELKLDKEVIKVTVAEEWEERIDAIGRTFLGLSLACARCHDHKFDPISAEDYYALAGVLASTRLADRAMLPAEQAEVVRKARGEVTQRQAQIKQLQDAKPPQPEATLQIDVLQREIAEIERTTPHYSQPMAHGIDDAALRVLADGASATRLEYRPGEAIDLNLQIRGNPSRLGPVVPRRFLTVLSSITPQPFTHGSGRLELAQAIVGEGAPLSARVIVNRVWKHHFGRGLVETPSDFGAQGAPPSHPALLDDLTARFIAGGWSLKWLHRELMLSATYRQSSEHHPDKFVADPENRWLWRMNRRRLDIEAWRDAMLAASGTLDLAVGGPSVRLTDVSNRRRTIYGQIDREEPDDMLRLHDFPDAASHSPNREPTTTPAQQLFVLNSPLVQRQAAALAERVLAERPGDVPAQVERAYWLLFGRRPSEPQLKLAVGYLAASEGKSTPGNVQWQRYAQVLLGSNEFLFID